MVVVNGNTLSVNEKVEIINELKHGEKSPWYSRNLDCFRQHYRQS